MKPQISKFLILLVLLFTASCGEPQTIVTDIVHPDGSVTRRLEMRNSKNDFEIAKIQVPFDTITWTIRDSVEVNEKGDTTWVRRAEKLYSDVIQLNLAYKSDSGVNKGVVRSIEFNKKFKWFNTEYRFSETFEQTLVFGYPVSDFLNRKELLWFYSNGNSSVINMKSFRPNLQNAGIFIDTSEYKTLDSLVKVKTDEWSIRNLISEWTHKLAELSESSGGKGINADSLKRSEDMMYEVISRSEDNFDTLWANGTILKELLGEENAKKYRTEADSAINLVLDKLFSDFSGFDQKILMPGKLIGGNGFIDSAGYQNWNVKSDFFMTEPYVMYAESKVTNWWAWIVSGIFILFVISGIIFRKMKKG